MAFYKRDHKNTQLIPNTNSPVKEIAENAGQKRIIWGKRVLKCVLVVWGPVKPPFHPHSPLDSLSMLASLNASHFIRPPALFLPSFVLSTLLSQFNMAVGGLLFISEIFAVFNTPFMYGLISVALLKASMCICLSTPSNCAWRYAYVCV